MDKISPTDEQISILDHIKGSSENLLINALAGTGKTTTLELIQGVSKIKPALCLAFNKRIAEEMKKRFPSTTSVRTFNSLGHTIWARAVGNVNLDPKKMQALLKAELDSMSPGEDKQELRDAYWDIISACSLAKALGYVPEGKFPHARRLISREAFHDTLEEKPSTLIASLVDTLLLNSIQAAYKGAIDFNDQIYMPALFGGTFPRFPDVLIDEAQDLNPTNHAMLDKLVRGRICAVGDPWQSIYGFRGSVTQGMEILKSRFAMQEKTISISFRCPQAIVEAARWRVPHFKWVKKGGHVEHLRGLSPNDIPNEAAILCRNNAPLLRMAFALLSARRSVRVAGSDIGPKIIRLLKKFGDDNTKKESVLAAISNWQHEKLEKSNYVSAINDIAECMKIFATFGSTLGQAIGYAENLFAQEGSIQLLTGHKAKGGEWDVVYHLNPWLIGECEQELNLRYVIQTRARESYYEIDYNDIGWN